MSKLKYVIKFAAKSSGQMSFGQKDTFPLKAVQFPGPIFSNGRKETRLNTSCFTIFEADETSLDNDLADLAQQLRDYLTEMVTTKMMPDTITIMEIIMANDSLNYMINKTVQHNSAVVACDFSRSVFTIVSEKATMSTFLEGEGTRNITLINFKNNCVNCL